MLPLDTESLGGYGCVWSWPLMWVAWYIW